jgi:hypothetical protein
MQLKNKLMTLGCVAVTAAALIAGVACNEHEMAPFSKSLSSGKKQSTSSGSARPVDILFIIDDSNSMKEEQSDLDKQFNVFLERLIAANANFRIATVSTSYSGAGMPFVTNALDTGSQILLDDGVTNIDDIKARCEEYYGNGNVYNFKDDDWAARNDSAFSSLDAYESKNWIDFTDFAVGTNSTFDAESHSAKRNEIIRDLFRCQALIGTTGDGTEKGLATMKSSLANARDFSDIASTVKNFKRKGSILTIVFVTDENDCSSTSLLTGSECETKRNIEDSCIVTRGDRVLNLGDEVASTLQLSTGQAFDVNGKAGTDTAKKLREWCVAGDEEARKALQNCLDAGDECPGYAYIKCPEDEEGNKVCENSLDHRSDYYNFLLDYVISSNEPFYRAQNAELFAGMADAAEHRSKLIDLAKSDIIIASIINRDQGMRFDTAMPENWCGTAGSQGYRYQLFAEMFDNEPIYAPICCRKEGFKASMIIDDKTVASMVCSDDQDGVNGQFGPVLSTIGQRIGKAVNTLCADAAPVTCSVDDCGDGTDGNAKKSSTCPCLYGCNPKTYLANSGNEYHVCNEFEFKVGAVDAAGEYKDYKENVNYSIDFNSNYCRSRTGSPIQVNMITTELDFMTTIKNSH